jgi:uncharacterized protein (TIGR00299 family) protein
MPRRSSTGSDRRSRGRRTPSASGDGARPARKERAGRKRAKKAARSGKAAPAKKTARAKKAAGSRKKAARAGRPARRGGEAASPGARVLHLDTFSGIAGNMFAAALLDLGLSRKALEEDLAGLDVPHAIALTRVRRGALAARYFDVRVPGQRRPPKTASRPARGAGHVHGSDPDRSHVASHDHAPHPAPAEGGGRSAGHGAHDHGRSYREIVELLAGARLRPTVRERALALFEALGRAEARVHGVDLDAVHFHEVGAVDAIVDVTAAASGVDRLGIERVTATPVALGHGTVDTAHGRLPLPAPATLELLKGIPTVPAHVAWETVTPTGAAILRVLVDEFTTLPAMTIEAVGIGAGNDRPGPMPNVLRAVLGRAAGGPVRDRVAVIETHLDDLVPEHFDHLMERLFEAGALDVALQHLQMKKNRPGFGVRVLARPADRDGLARLLFAESTAIGVRVQESERLVLEREARHVTTAHGRIGVKIVRGPDGGLQFSAEYDDCKRAARRTGAPLREVVRAAEDAARSAFG